MKPSHPKGQTTFEHPIQSVKQALIVSPHCDDAALAMGGTIYELCQRRVRIDILNCFTVSAYSATLSSRDVSAVTSIRKSEEESMASLCGDCPPNLYFFDLPDAPLRPERTLENLFDGRTTRLEEHLSESITEAVICHEEGVSFVFVPLAIGGHVDHRICRLACERMASKARLIYYEDQPYQSLAKSSNPQGTLFNPAPILLQVDIQAKARLLDCYPSQIYPNERASVLAYADYLGRDFDRPIERFWRSATE